MAINFGLAQPSGGYDYLETLRALGSAQALQQDMASQAQRQQIQGYQFDRVREQDTARPQILQQAQGGDSAGAQQRAFAIGDYDALKALQGLDEQKRGQLATQMGTLGRLATSLIKLPAEQRQQAYQAVAPMLVKQGFDSSLVQSADLSDGGLRQYIAAAGSTDDVLKNYYKQQEGYTLNQGDRRYVGGDLVAENPAAAKYQAVPEGGMLVRTDGGSATPVFGMGGGGQASGSSAAAGRYQYGWTPRARNGGDNSDAAVDSKIAGMSQALGIDPAQPFPPGVTATQIAQALTLSEGGRGSLADRNNNPGNLRDPRTGDYRKFPTKEAGLAAAAAQVRRNLARGQNTIQSMVEGLPAGGGRQAQGGSDPNVIYGRPKQPNVPSGYESDGAGGLRPIRGGPADPTTSTQRNVQSNRKAEAEFRKEFEGRKDVQSFRSARTQFNALRDTALNPRATAQDDIAVIFQFMKTLDPTSTVREGEFATAQNAGGIPDTIRNAFNKAQNGERLNPEQRRNMAKTAYRSYQAFRDAYNQTAEQFRGYAKDNGIDPDRVARTYTPDKPARSQGRAAIGVGQSTQVGGFKVTRVK